MKEIKAVIKQARLYEVLSALRDIPGMPGFIVSETRAYPGTHADPRSQSHGIDAIDSRVMAKIECVVLDEKAPLVVEAIARAAHTGDPGDGKIFVLEVQEAVKIRTGERGEEAL